MPYKTGKLKGKITGAEIRKLIRAHNVLVSIKIPPKTDRDGLIALIKKNGFKLDEVKGEITGKSKEVKISLGQAKEITKPKEKTELQKQKIKEKKEEKEKKKKKEVRQIKKEAIKKEKEVQKKKEKKTTKPKEKKKVVVKKVQEKKPNVRQLPPKKPHDLNKKKVKKPFKPKGNEIKPPQQPKKILSQTPAPPTRIQAPAKKDATPPQDKIQKPSVRPPPLRARKQLKETGKKVESKKVQDNPDNFEIIQVKSDYPINVELYNDIKNIPAGDVFDNLVLKKSNIFYPWTSAGVVSDIMFYHILKDNKSTCALPWLVNTAFHDDFCKFKSKKIQGAKAKKDADGKLIAQNTWKCRPVDAVKKWSSTIARRFIECSLNDDALPLAITKDGNRKQTSTHANMLLLNPILMTAEHFEPHGEAYEGSYEKDKKKYFVPPQSNLNPAIKHLNKSLEANWLLYRDEKDKLKPRLQQAFKKWNDAGLYLKKPPQLKYETMAQTCPSKSVQAKLDGYQEGDLGRDKTPRLFDGVLITEIGGYCKMWSLFHLDLRLKTLKKKSSEVFTDMIKRLSDKKDEMGGRYIELMRGMSRYAWEQVQEALKNPKYNKHGATKEEFIKYLNKDKFASKWKVSDAIVHMKMDLANKYIMKDDDSDED